MMRQRRAENPGNAGAGQELRRQEDIGAEMKELPGDGLWRLSPSQGLPLHTAHGTLHTTHAHCKLHTAHYTSPDTHYTCTLYTLHFTLHSK